MLGSGRAGLWMGKKRSRGCLVAELCFARSFCLVCVDLALKIPVEIFAVAYPNNKNKQPLFSDLIRNAVIAGPNSIDIFCALNLLFILSAFFSAFACINITIFSLISIIQYEKLDVK